MLGEVWGSVLECRGVWLSIGGGVGKCVGVRGR